MNRLHPSLRQLLVLVALIFAGWMFSWLSGIEGLTDLDVYMYSIVALLAIGLYGGTSSISIEEAKNDFRTILLVVTVGVVLKATLVGAVLAAIFRDPIFILLAVTVAQIDPLSVAALMKDSHLSTRARTVLASWSAFDDPVTVVLTLSLVTAMGRSLAGEERDAEAFAGLEGLAGLGASLFFNALLVLLGVLLWLLIRRLASRYQVGVGVASVLVVAGLAVWRSLLLGLAVAGLFLRPPSRTWTLWVERAVTAAFYAAAVMLGILLVSEINLAYGVALGVMAYLAQVIVGFLLTMRLPHADRVHLALSQQNGITSIILALTLEPAVPGVVAVVGPAVITINLLHYAMGRLVSRQPQLFGIRPEDDGAISVAPPLPPKPADPPGLLEYRSDRTQDLALERMEIWQPRFVDPPIPEPTAKTPPGQVGR